MNLQKIYRQIISLMLAMVLAACGGANSGDSSVSISATATTTAQSLTVGTAMVSFSPLTPRGGTAPYTYNIASGTLPAGLSLNSTTGAVTGTPTATYATASVVFSVQDANGVVANTTSSVLFTVGAASDTISATATTTTQSLVVGTAMASFSPLTPSGGAAPYTYSIASGTLPEGLSLNATTGAITGTPSATYAAAVVVFAVKDANSVAASTTSTVIFVVRATPITITAQTATTTAITLPVGTAMASFSPLFPLGGAQPYTYSVVSGALPAGLNLDSSTGAVTGIPSAAQSAANVVFAVQDANGVVASTTSTVSFSVSAAPVALTTLANTSDQNLVMMTPMTSFAPLKASGGTPPYTYEYFGTLPTGLGFDASTGVVSGTPTVPYTTANLYFLVTDANHVMASTTSTVKFTVAPAYSIGGTISGLKEGSVVLQDNGGNDLTLSANGAFTFSKLVQDTKTYAVTVLLQPVGQTCSVATGAGTVSGGNVSNVNVTCSSNAYTVGGSISNLSGSITLQNNAGDNLTLTSSGTYAFTTPVAYISHYAVTVLTQPAGQSCSVANGSGTMGAGNVGNVNITCSTHTHTVGGTVTGLKDTVVLQNNGGDNQTIAVNGPFNFPTAINYGSPYNVSVLTQPANNRHCNITNGSGTIAGNVSNVGVACFDNLISGGIQTGVKWGQPTMVSTLVGTYGSLGYTSGTGNNAWFNMPSAVTTDGTNLYVADSGNQVIRKVVIATGEVSLVAGQPLQQGYIDGASSVAKFRYPQGVTTDGVNLYVADTYNHRIRKVIIATGEVSTLAGSGTSGNNGDGFGTAVRFNNPTGITLDPTNQYLYVSDSGNNLVRKIVIATGEVITLAGSGTSGYTAYGFGTAVKLSVPGGLTSPDGVNLYVADTSNHVIRKIVIATGEVITLAGVAQQTAWVDGPGTAAKFNSPMDITSDGYNLYVADWGNSVIRKIVIATGEVSTYVGLGYIYGYADGTPDMAQFSYPSGIVSDGHSVFVADHDNSVIRQVK